MRSILPAPDAPLTVVPVAAKGRGRSDRSGWLAGVNSNISYTYTLDGTRLAKQVGSTKTAYTLDGNLVIRQKTGNEILNFYYDSAGKLLEIGYKANTSAAETYYSVARNSQGDIGPIGPSVQTAPAVYASPRTASGAPCPWGEREPMTWVVELYKSADSTLVGSYSYDSWGKLLGATYATGVDVSSVYDILNKNPFRYRGYYYDQETSWYYLQSRYYDPEVKRFVNSDVTSLVTVSSDEASIDKNLYAYCDNNPVMRADEGGHFWHIVAGGVFGAIISGAATAISSYVQNGEVDWKATAVSAVSGAISGVVGATTLNPFAQAGIAAAVSGTSNLVEQGMSKGFDNINGGEVLLSGFVGATGSLVGSTGSSMATESIFREADKATQQLLLPCARNIYKAGYLTNSVIGSQVDAMGNLIYGNIKNDYLGW